VKVRETDRGAVLFNGARASREGVIALDRSDLLDMLGVGDMPIHVAEAKIIAGQHNHGLTIEHWKKIPEWLSNPSVVFDSDTVAGRMVFIAPETLDGKPIVMIVEPNVSVGEIDVHLLVNAYDKTNGRMPVERWVNERMTRYIDKTKSRQFLATSGLQLPRVLQSVIGSSHKIHTEADLVKYRAKDQSSFSVENGFLASQDMSFSVIEAEIIRMRQEWSAMPPVKVVNKVSDLPFAAPSNADGAYCDGRVYVVAENIIDLKQVQKVMAHECVLHHSLFEMLGDYGFSKLHVGIQGLKEAGDPVVTKLAGEILQRYGVLPPQDETKEIVARAGEQCLDDTGNVKVGFGFMKSVFAGVAGWLRDHGISVPFTNTELQGIMHDAGES